MNMTPLVTIVTPSYNQGEYIEDTLKSVFSQKGNFELEYFVLDGGSSDNTVDVIRKYSRLLKAQKIKPPCKRFRFWWFSASDGGQSEALIQGFSMSMGSILGWINSDDYYSSPNSVNNIVSTFLKYPKADIVTGNIRHVDVKGNVLDEHSQVLGTESGFISIKNLEAVMRHSTIPQPAAFFRRKVWEECELDLSLHYSMDWDLWIQAIKHGHRFYKINEFTACERIQPNAKTVAHKPEMYQEWIRVHSKHNLWPIERFVYYKYVLLGLLRKLKISYVR